MWAIFEVHVHTSRVRFAATAGSERGLSVSYLRQRYATLPDVVKQLPPAAAGQRNKNVLRHRLRVRPGRGVGGRTHWADPGASALAQVPTHGRECAKAPSASTSMLHRNSLPPGCVCECVPCVCASHVCVCVCVLCVCECVPRVCGCRVCERACRVCVGAVCV